MKKAISVKLLRKYLRGNCYPLETTQIQEWFDSFDNASSELEELSATEKAVLEELLFARIIDNIYDHENITGANRRPVINQEDEPVAPKQRVAIRTLKLWKRIAVAASLIFCLGFTSYFLLRTRPADKITILKEEKHDALPGGNKALLTLANGTKIILNNSQNGMLATQGNASITKARDGKIVYNNNNDGAGHVNAGSNNITTPKGGQYQVVLPDGTKVWLNSASSLTYPVTFTGNTREIQLAGEAYFEVVHDSQKPFQVVSNGQVVEVLGTHFNVNTYNDEPAAKTTLMEGSVKITANALTRKIKPGEQAQIINGKMTIEDADLEEVMAWKNGFFYFKDADVKTVMRQLSRWYDVEVKYEGEIPTKEFSGQIARNINASQLLRMLSIVKIHYTITDKTITIKR